MTIKAQDFKRAAKTLEQLKKAGENWDFKSFEHNRTALRDEMSRLLSWEEFLVEIDTHLREKKTLVVSQAYHQELEEALRKADLPLKGSFPRYSIIPFELEFLVEEETVHFRLGRNIEKTGLFEPYALAEWVKKRYTSVVKRSFKAKSFFGDLRAAYEIANRLVYGQKSGTQVLWGRAVDLKQIYKLLTLRSENRREYSQERFVYDLARLRAEGLTYAKYELEFGFKKTSSGSLIVPDLPSGGEERFSTLTIYYREG